MAIFTKLNEEEDFVDEYIEEETESSVEETYEDDLDNLTEVEVRLEEANCFRALLKNSLFEEPLSPIAKRVESKIREFIKNELKDLMGLSIPKEVKNNTFVPTFSPEEEKVLKTLAAKILTREQATQPPAVNQVQVKTSIPEPIVKKTVSEPLVNKSTKAKKKKDTKRKLVSKEVTINGETAVVNIDVTGQTKPPTTVTGGYPALNFNQQADIMQQQALTAPPPGGLLGALIKTTNPQKIDTNEE